MAHSPLMDLITEVLDIYRDVDRATSVFQLATGLRCPSRCGWCCEDGTVESTVLECLPLANAIHERGEKDLFFSKINEKIDREDRRCVVYCSDKEKRGEGSCSYYDGRVLVCRLFGFAARRSKSGKPEPSLCKVIKERNPELIKNLVEGAEAHHFTAPIYQDSFMRIASLHPGLGYRLLPINVALRDALDYLCFRKPGKFTQKKAA